MAIKKEWLFNKLRKLMALIPVAGILSGCASVDPYEHMSGEAYEYQMEQIMNHMDTEGMTAHEVIANYLFRFTDGMKARAPIFIVVSIIIGIGLLFTIRKNLKIRKFAIFGFIIGFPMITILSTYVLAFLTGMFL